MTQLPPQKMTLTEGIKAGTGGALRSGSEFLGGVITCSLLGWGIESWLGGQPWGLVGGTLMGLVVGVWNVTKHHHVLLKSLMTADAPQSVPQDTPQDSSHNPPPKP